MGVKGRDSVDPRHRNIERRGDVPDHIRRQIVIDFLYLLKDRDQSARIAVVPAKNLVDRRQTMHHLLSFFHRFLHDTLLKIKGQTYLMSTVLIYLFFKVSAILLTILRLISISCGSFGS